MSNCQYTLPEYMQTTMVVSHSYNLNPYLNSCIFPRPYKLPNYLYPITPLQMPSYLSGTQSATVSTALSFSSPAPWPPTLYSALISSLVTWATSNYGTSCGASPSSTSQCTSSDSGASRRSNPLLIGGVRSRY